MEVTLVQLTSKDDVLHIAKDSTFGSLKLFNNDDNS